MVEDAGFDPWRDTDAERPPQRDDPFDEPMGPFGTMSELMGVPRMAAGSSTPRRMLGSRVLTRGLVIAMVAAIVVGVLVTLAGAL